MDELVLSRDPRFSVHLTVHDLNTHRSQALVCKWR